MISIKHFLESIDQSKDVKAQVLACQSLFPSKRPFLEEIFLLKRIQAEKVDSLIKLINDDPLLHFDKMKKVLEHSEFFFNFSESKWSITIVFFHRIESENNKLDNIQLHELYQKALLHKNLELQLPEELKNKDYIKLYNNFLVLFIEAEKMLEILEKINSLSCPELEQKYCISVKHHSIENFNTEIKILQLLYDKWEGILIAAYSTFPTFTYFLPSQIATLENYFTDPISYKDKQGVIYLLNYAGIKIDKSAIQEKYIVPERLEDRVMYLCKFLEKINAIPSIISRKKSLSVDCLCSKDLVWAVCQLYYSRNLSLPHASQLLFCQENTTWERIMNFTFRILQNPDKYFLFINIDLLPPCMQQNLVKILMNKNNRALIPPFGLICKNFQGLFINYFESRQVLVKLQHNTPSYIGTMLKAALGEDYSNLYIVVSEAAGYGKSSYIKTIAEEKYLTVKYLSIYGTLSFRKIAKQIKGIIPDLRGSRAALCFKILTVINPEILDEIFFRIIILRCLEYDSKVLLLPPQLTIFVEIANTKKNSLEKNFELLKYFPFKDIGISALFSILDIRNDTLSKTISQLKFLYNISNDTTPKIINKLFCKAFNVTDLNDFPMSKLSIFLQFFSNQIKKYENSHFCSVVKKIDKDNTIHYKIVKMLLETARSLMNNSVDNQEIGQSEEEKLLVNSSELFQGTSELQNRNITAICFTQEGNLLPLVYNNPSLPKDVQDLLLSVDKDYKKLKLSQDLKQLSQINYSKMKHQDYLKVLRRSFNKPNLEAKDYVFTYDNFFKMLYIYIRAIAGLPIILVGKTGCGKTRMINFLCNDILSCSLFILNIHAGFTDEDIIHKVSEVIEKAKIKRSETFWVFFDEFNTNKNIGLFKEIICDRMLLGLQIPSNIVFLASCNPYKKLQRKKMYENAAGFEQNKSLVNADNSLIYRVFPSPSTITQMAWDFGPINIENEKEYILAILDSGNYPSSEIRNIVNNVVITTHKKLKDSDELHILSLRDIRRFLYLYEYFSNSVEREITLNPLPLPLCFAIIIAFQIHSFGIRSVVISILFYTKSLPQIN